jgi:Tfp pilus assembly protein PilO
MDPVEQNDMSRRKKWARWVARVAVFLALADGLVYVAVDQPLARIVKSERERLSSQRIEGQARKLALAHLEQRDAELPETRRRVQAFLTDHVPARREGFSRASRLVERVAQQSGVQLTSVSYKPDGQDAPQPLDRLTMGVRVQGSFAGLMSFSHGLETASDFIVVRAFKFQATETANDAARDRGSGTLGLNLTADFYLLP